MIHPFWGGTFKTWIYGLNASLYHQLNVTAGYALIVVVLTIILKTELFAPSFSHTHGEGQPAPTDSQQWSYYFYDCPLP